MPIQQILLGVGGSTKDYITNNLVFHLDPADTNCYSGSGTTVNSLVNSHTNDHFGDITWDSDSSGDTGGYFEYDGDQDSGLQFPYSSDFEYGYDGTNTVDDYTWEWWWYGANTSFSGGNKPPYIWFNNVSSSGQPKNDQLTATGVHIFKATSNIKVTISSGTDNFSPITWTGSKWQHFVLQKEGTTGKLYVDKTLLDTETLDGSYSTLDTSKKLIIGGPYYGGLGSKKTPGMAGRFGVVRFYQGKALTTTEITQNYDAEKSRYT